MAELPPAKRVKLQTRVNRGGGFNISEDELLRLARGDQLAGIWNDLNQEQKDLVQQYTPLHRSMSLTSFLYNTLSNVPAQIAGLVADYAMAPIHDYTQLNQLLRGPKYNKRGPPVSLLFTAENGKRLWLDSAPLTSRRSVLSEADEWGEDFKEEETEEEIAFTSNGTTVHIFEKFALLDNGTNGLVRIVDNKLRVKLMNEFCASRPSTLVTIGYETPYGNRDQLMTMPLKDTFGTVLLQLPEADRHKIRALLDGHNACMVGEWDGQLVFVSDDGRIVQETRNGDFVKLGSVLHMIGDKPGVMFARTKKQLKRYKTFIEIPLS